MHIARDFHVVAGRQRGYRVLNNRRYKLNQPGTGNLFAHIRQAAGRGVIIAEIAARAYPDGYTALYDALGVYLSGASALTGQKVLVAYTDGGDTRSSINAGEVTDLVSYLVSLQGGAR